MIDVAFDSLSDKCKTPFLVIGREIALPSKACHSCKKLRPIFGGSGLCRDCYSAAVQSGEVVGEMPAKCSVEGCDQWAAKGAMCDKHYRRVLDHGHADKVRREGQHPEYQNWWWLKARGCLCLEWMEFDVFVAAIGDRPSGRHRIARKDENQPYSPDNWYWRGPKLAEPHSTKTVESRRDYARAVAKTEPGRWVGTSLKLYGLTIDDYERILNEQGGVCASCGEPESECGPNGKAKLLVVDHDHAGSFVRGLLCASCNKALGFANDDPAKLRKLANYIEKAKVTPIVLMPVSATCDADGCRAHPYKLGLCSRHYQQQHRGKPLSGLNTCLHCGAVLDLRSARAKFCNPTCRSSWHRQNGAYTQEAILKSRGSCSIEGCENAVHAEGYCKSHNMRLWRYGDPLYVPPAHPKKPCTVAGCEKNSLAKGLCQTHYYQDRRRGRDAIPDGPPEGD
jgi:hypothetical protein